MGIALSNLPSLEVPPAELLLVVIVGYILLIGPISYVLLRRAWTGASWRGSRRRCWWWSSPPARSASEPSLKGSAVILNQITAHPHEQRRRRSATVESYAGVFSPDRSTYDLTRRGRCAHVAHRTRTPSTAGRAPTSRRRDRAGRAGPPARPGDRRLRLRGRPGRRHRRARARAQHHVANRGRRDDRHGHQQLGETPVTDVAYVSSSRAAT